MFFSKQLSASTTSTSSSATPSNSLVVATGALAAAVTTANAETFDILQAIDDAITQRSALMVRPKISSELKAIATNAVTSVAAEVTKQVAPELATTDTTCTPHASILATAVASGTVLVSAATQFSSYYQRVRNTQAAQEALIKGIINNIRECYYLVKDNDKFKDAKLSAEMDLTADNVIKMMQQKGYITIELNVPESKFTLLYNSLCSMRTAAVFGLSVIPAVILASAQLSSSFGYDSYEIEGTTHAALVVATGTPIGKIVDHCSERYQEVELNLLRAYRLVLEKLYVKPGLMHELTLEFTKPLAAYLPLATAEQVTKLVVKTKELRIKDLEAGKNSLRLTNGGT